MQLDLPSTKIQQISQLLFKQILNNEKLEYFSTMSPEELKLVCRETGRIFLRKVRKKPNQVIAFLSNYHKIVEKYNVKNSGQIINNVSLHFLVCSSYAMIQSGQKDSAKQMLKKSLKFLKSKNPDPILLTTALNNLCVLRIQSGKYYKSVNILLQMIQIMQDHMQSLKYSKKKGQIIEDSVFLINSYYLLSKCLIKITEINHKQFYKQLLKYSNHTGLRKAIKYLGRQSVLTKQFMKLSNFDEDQFELPIYFQEQQQKSTILQQILKKLARVQQFMQNPREPIIIKQIIKETAIPAPTKFVRKPEQELICQRFRKINNWEVEVQLLKEKNQKLGSFYINCVRGQNQNTQNVSFIIGQQKFYKLISFLNLTDILPDQCSFENLTPFQIIEYCIFNFLHISDNKNIQMFPRALTLVPPFTFQVFKKEYIVFMYFIHHQLFRLAFGTKQTSETLHLQIQFRKQFIEEMFQIQEQTQKRMFVIYEMLMKSDNLENNFKVIDEKVVKVKNQREVIQTVQSILKSMETFIEGQLNQGINFLQQKNEFFKYHQSKDHNKGKFYYVRFIDNIKAFDIYIQNTYETYKPEGKSKAKGNFLYSAAQFSRDFGISSQLSFKKFRCFAQIICKKYNLKYFQNPLSSRDVEIYQQNSINELKITQKTFLRKMRYHKNYTLPLTISIVTINNQIPIGLRLSCYSPILGYESGYFIYVDCQKWQWPQKPEQGVQDVINNVVEQYDYKKNYFLVDWLKRIGFWKILQISQIDKDDNFQIQGLYGIIYRMTNILDLVL